MNTAGGSKQGMGECVAGVPHALSSARWLDQVRRRLVRLAGAVSLCSVTASCSDHRVLQRSVLELATDAGECAVDAAALAQCPRGKAGGLDLYDVCCLDDCATSLAQLPCGGAELRHRQTEIEHSCGGESAAAKADDEYRRLVWNNLIDLYDAGEPRWQSWLTLGNDDVLADCRDLKPGEVDPRLFDQPAWNFESFESVGSEAMPVVFPLRQNPVWDQSGNPVFNEVRLNSRAVVLYECANVEPEPEELATQTAAFERMLEDACFQADPAQVTRKLQWGKVAPATQGEMRLKLAWKRLVEGVDDSARYITREPLRDEPGVVYGLVAAHVVILTTTSNKRWLWSTFSHVYNVPGERTVEDGVKPSFNDPTCTSCKPNTCPACEGTGAARVCRTQVERVNPVDAETSAVNRAVWDSLPKHSALRYYELLGVQHMRQPFSESDTEDAPRQHLASEVIEWDHQASGCMACHSYAPVARLVKGKPDASCNPATDVEFHPGPYADMFWQYFEAYQKEKQP